ncbi:MAG: phosphodiester glycosidase family protein [Mucinivorans sp.]
MKYFILTIALLLSVSDAFSQNQSDSIYFCDSKNWRVLHNDSGLIVKELRSNYKHKQTYLFNVPIHIYVMEVPLDGYRIGIVQSSRKKRSRSLQKSSGAIASVNGGFFRVDQDAKNNAIANDFLKINGHIISPHHTTGWGNGAIAFDTLGQAHFAQWRKEMDADTISGWSADYPNVIVAGPMLILDNKVTAQNDIRHPRTAMGTRGENTIIFLVVDGRRKKAAGANFSEMAKYGQWLGLNNMLNLDGGGSSTMLYKNHLVNFPSDGLGVLPIERKIANAIVVYPRTQTK